MTADTKLLPLPELASERVFGAKWDDFDMQDYARANVAHATEPLKAEIEALRAEVAAVWNAMPSGTRYLDPPDGGDVPLHEQVRRMAADAAHAERLAEALSWYAEQAELCRKLGAAGDSGRRALDADGGKRARAALRDHDKEEK